MNSEPISFDTFWKTGDMGTFKLLMKTFGPPLHYFAGTIVDNRQEAEEIVADVFIRVWQQRESLPPPHNIKFYLFKAVKNTALNYLKGKGRRSMHEAAWEVTVSHRQARSPEDILISKEDIRSIQAIIGSLPPRCRQIFILVKEEGLSYEEVAQLLDISKATVNVQITLAMKKIWGALSPALRVSHS